ncbi:MAG: CHRD domain-containing protein [Acidobacteriota bacterium]|nr:CHRD domain-containing protein [Acidobacteriota bacterium]
MKRYFPSRLLSLFVINFCFVVSAFADTTFTAVLNGLQEAPPNNSTATGGGSVILNSAETQVTITLNFSGLTGTQTATHIHKGERGVTGGVEIGLPNGSFSQTFPVTALQVADLKAGLWYFNVHSSTFQDGEIRGQIEPFCTPPFVGTAAWYRAENSANDWSGGNNGSLQNGATFVTGKVGQAFNLDGTDDYISAADTTSLRPVNLAIQGWFNFAAVSGGIMIAKTAGIGTNESFVLYYDGTFLRGAVGGPNGLGEIISISFTPVAGDWYHIAYTFDDFSDTQILYINGVAVAAEAATASIIYDAHPLTIGAEYENGALSYFFKGKIDEVQIYNRALSASEIQSIYQSRSSGVCVSNAIFTSLASNGKIAFFKFYGGPDSGIFTMNPDGTNQTNISANLAYGSTLAFSPDGSKIALKGYENGNHDIYVMNSEGSNPVRLTTDANFDGMPTWSPDGTKIVFSSNRDSSIHENNNEIYIMNADGSNQTRLTTNSTSDVGARFSPDGSKIVFSSDRDGYYEIYVMDADGSNQTRLTNSPYNDELPSFSPDGSKIVFQSYRTLNYEIFVMNANGTNQINLSNTLGVDKHPAWSPDGTKIAFTSNRSVSDEIYVMNPDGSNQTRLTNNSASDFFPAWQPIVGGSITVDPASNLRVIFGQVTSVGFTVASQLNNRQVPRLPAGYSLRSGFAYDIRTSAQHSGGVNIQFTVPGVFDAQTCSVLRVLHRTNGDWDESNNVAPTFNSNVCIVKQTATSLSTFVVAQHTPGIAQTGDGAILGNLLYATTPANQPAKFVSNVLLTATGTTNNRTALTNTSGAYLLNNLNVNDSYAVTLSKLGNVNGITAFDATLVLRCIAAATNCSLTPNQRLAANTDGDSNVTAFDAIRILRFVAANGSNANTGQVGNWKFDPISRNYNPTLNSLAGENYTAVLIGEIDGDWTAPSGNSGAVDNEKFKLP